MDKGANLWQPYLMQSIMAPEASERARKLLNSCLGHETFSADFLVPEESKTVLKLAVVKDWPLVVELLDKHESRNANGRDIMEKAFNLAFNMECVPEAELPRWSPRILGLLICSPSAVEEFVRQMAKILEMFEPHPDEDDSFRISPGRLRQRFEPIPLRLVTIYSSILEAISNLLTLGVDDDDQRAQGPNPLCTASHRYSFQSVIASVFLMISAS